MRKVEIRQAPAVLVAGIAYRGDYVDIGMAFGQLHETLTRRALYREGQHNIAVYLDDVAKTAAAECRALAGRTWAPGQPADPPLERLDLAAGDYAVMRHVGPYAELGRTYRWLFGVWLPGSGRAAADLPCYEIYRNTPMEAEPQNLITEIFLPLK